MAVFAVPARRGVLVDLLLGARVRDVVLVACGAGLTGLAAQVVVPLPGTPVPVTGQTFGVLLASAALGWHQSVSRFASGSAACKTLARPIGLAMAASLAR